MKVEDYIATRQVEKPKGCPCEKPVALMLTYKRPGLLLGAVESFLKTADGIPLHVFDDGSEDGVKDVELNCVEEYGVKVHVMLHRGFALSWLNMLKLVKETMKDYDSVVMLEDDIVFAKGWLDVLVRMQKGINELGMKQGMTTCFRPHERPQSAIVDLQGVKAYQSMAHTFHANMMPMEILDRMDVLEQSVDEAVKSKMGHGIDVYWVGNLAHRLNRVSFISEQSWVAHVGIKRSLVEAQGFGPCRHSGVNLVKELEEYDMMKNCPVV